MGVFHRRDVGAKFRWDTYVESPEEWAELCEDPETADRLFHKLQVRSVMRG